jgi:hypothetical protein
MDGIKNDSSAKAAKSERECVGVRTAQPCAFLCMPDRQRFETANVYSKRGERKGRGWQRARAKGWFCEATYLHIAAIKGNEIVWVIRSACEGKAPQRLASLSWGFSPVGNGTEGMSRGRYDASSFRW